MTQPKTNQPIFLKELSSIKSSYDIANELLLASQIAKPKILRGFSDMLWKPDSESIFKSEVEKVIDEFYNEIEQIKELSVNEVQLCYEIEEYLKQKLGLK